jgi:hypothetical protein
MLKRTSYAALILLSASAPATANSFFTQIADGVKDASSLQAVLAAIGVALIGAASSVWQKSRTGGAGVVLLGLVMIIAPLVLPGPKLETTSSLSAPSTIAGNWRIYESGGWGFDWAVKSNEAGDFRGSMVVKSCPQGSPCPKFEYTIDGRYVKDKAEISFVRRPTGIAQINKAPDQTYTAVFRDGGFARGVFNTDQSTFTVDFVIYQP